MIIAEKFMAFVYLTTTSVLIVLPCTVTGTDQNDAARANYVKLLKSSITSLVTDLGQSVKVHIECDVNTVRGITNKKKSLRCVLSTFSHF